MTVITARIIVSPDGTISGRAPGQVPAGEHEASITVADRPAQQLPSEPFDVNDLPTHDLGPWPAGLSLRREDIWRLRALSFVDTNVLVYATAAGAPFHAQARAALARLASSEPIAISRQILREYMAVTTRPQVWAKALTLVEAITDTETFSRRFTILEDGVAVWEKFVLLSRGFPFGGRQVHDANIVATMLAHGETRLLTFNEADFRRFSSVIEIVVP